jgi:hypothetical protein
MGLVDDIKNNALTTLSLSEAPEDYFSETSTFLEAMEANSSIEEAVFTQDFLSCAVGNQRRDIVSRYVFPLPDENFV